MPREVNLTQGEEFYVADIAKALKNQAGTVQILNGPRDWAITSDPGHSIVSMVPLVRCRKTNEEVLSTEDLAQQVFSGPQRQHRQQERYRTAGA
jgi:hypothetical protein